jgi:Tol biopolymer transport system component
MPRSLRLVTGLCVALLLAAAPNAFAAFAGRDGILATDDSDGACTGSCADTGGPGNRVWTVDPRTGAATAISSSDVDAQAFEPSWSPTGQLVFTQFAFPFSNLTMAVSNAAGAGVRTISLPSLNYEYDPSFTADNNHLLFAAQTSVSRKLRYDVYTVRLDGTGLKRVTHLSASVGPSTPIQSPTGRIAFAWKGWIYLLGRSGKPKRLVRGSTPDFSPSGNRIVFEDHHLRALETIGVNGRGLRRLTPLPRPDTCSGASLRPLSAHPAYSPSGKFIVFTRYGNCGSPPPRLVVIHADGTHPRTVLRGDPAQDPTWQPLEPLIP